MNPARVCLTPRLVGVGGMVSFQDKLARGLKQRGIEVTYDLADPACRAVLVIGGTRHLRGLWQARRRGIPVVQRLDGMNWLHRVRPTGLRHYLRSEYGNALLALIRSRLASQIVYQSRFSKSWWERKHGLAPVSDRVVYNGVDLDVYSPVGPRLVDADLSAAGVFRLLLVEGSLSGGYEMGLETAAALGEQLERQYHLPVEIMVAGQVSDALKAAWQKRQGTRLSFLGRLTREQIPALDRSAHLLYSADLNPACPNSVIEALACGLPVVAFDTGALPELVDERAGRVVPYGGNSWRLDPPDVTALAKGAAEVLNDPVSFRAGARERAEALFGIDKMVAQYVDVLLGK